MPADTVSVLCLPHAGAGANFFWKWQQETPPGLRLVPLQLPGREERVEEEPYRSVAEAVRALLPEATDAVSGSRQVAVFGHSLGAVLAYELARSLEDRTELPVAHVFVSGSPGPQRGRTEQAAALDDDAFLARVEEFAGYRHAAFDVPEFRTLLLPTLRADVAMHEAYRPSADVPIEAAVTCLRGDDDRLVSEEDALQWRTATTGAFHYAGVPGGHMYLTEQARRVVGLMATTLGCAGEPLGPARTSTGGR